MLGTDSRHLLIAREDSPRYDAAHVYEDEGSTRAGAGSVAVSRTARWMATLSVPLPNGNVAFLHLERRGPLPDGYRGSEESALFSMPATEVDAVLAAIAGVVSQVRRDGVLP